MTSLYLKSRLTITILRRKITQGLPGAVVWTLKGSQVPAPNYIKWRTLAGKFNRNSICIETGTYLGETTRWLSKKFPRIISLEPEEILCNFARDRFKRNTNITILNGSSEELFADVLEKIEVGSNVNFWLDGHFSDGITYKGQSNTPLIEELSNIKSNLRRFNRVVIAIDDFRDFKQENELGYPARSWLVEWAENNDFSWDVRNDIFFMENAGVYK